MEIFSDPFAVPEAQQPPLPHIPPRSHQPTFQADVHSVYMSGSKVLMNLLSFSWGKTLKLLLIDFFLSWQILRTSKPEQEARCPSVRARAWCCCVDHHRILGVKWFRSLAFSTQGQFGRFSFSEYVSESLKWDSLKEKAVGHASWPYWLNSVGDLRLGVSADKAWFYCIWVCT